MYSPHRSSYVVQKWPYQRRNNDKFVYPECDVNYFCYCCYVQDAKELLNNCLEQIRAGKSLGEIIEAADQGMVTKVIHIAICKKYCWMCSTVNNCLVASRLLQMYK